MSLLLEALKKAAQEKEKAGIAPVSDPAASKPASDVPETEQSGTQLMNLLQGKDSAPGEDLDSLDGFKPFDDSDEKTEGFSLSLISEDDELADQMSFKDRPLQRKEADDTPEVKPEEPPESGLEFELELLGDDELDDTPAAPVVTADTSPTPAASLSGLTLVDDDEPFPATAVETTQDEDEDEAKLDAAAEVELQVDDVDKPVDVPAAPVTDSELTLTASKPTPPAEEEELVAMMGPAEMSEPVAVPAEKSSENKASAEQPVPDAVSEVVEPAVTPKIAPEPEPEPEPVKAEPEPPVEPAPQPSSATLKADKPDVDPMDAVALQMGIKPGSSVYDASPDMVLGAMKGQKRRRRVLVLLLVGTVALTAGGFGYLQYEEQLLDNQQMLARYRVPVRRPAVPAPESVKPVVAAEQSIRGDSPAVAAPQVKTSMPVEPMPESPAEGIQEMTAEQLIAEAEAALAGNGQFSPDIDAIGDTGVEPEAPSESIETAKAPSAVSITRKTVTRGILSQDTAVDIGRRETEARVLSAYRAFKNGDIDRSLKLYQQALKEDPFSRDAVMGLAAIAVRQNDFGRAAYYYQQLLDYDPVDRAAFEGLISLPDGGLDPVEVESRLRNYLAKNPDSERAQNRLGQVLARQKRWHEAQSAFFNAYRLNPQSVSHALNIAISLDHMRKYNHARNYYEKALQLETRQGKASGMDLISVRQRLDTLSQVETP